MGLFSNKSKSSQKVGLVFTKKSLRRTIMQDAVVRTGLPSRKLRLVEDKKTRTAKVIDGAGRTRGQYSW